MLGGDAPCSQRAITERRAGPLGELGLRQPGAQPRLADQGASNPGTSQVYTCDAQNLQSAYELYMLPQ